MKWFLIATSFYGGWRSSPVLNHIELPGTKIMTFVIGTLATPIFFPVFIANDLNRAYIKIHNLDSAQYGFRNHERKNLHDLLFE